MRVIVTVSVALGVMLPLAASAQTAKNTPEGIVCAMTGSCDAPPAGNDRVSVGDEKAFSLARPNVAAPRAAQKPAYVASAMQRSRPTPLSRRIVPAKVHVDGGIDMLITFRSGSAQLTPQARAEARTFAKAMAAPQMAKLHFAIEGHTDAVGDHNKNMTLSQARAQSVADFLVSQGIDSARLTAKGYGPDRPINGVLPTSAANRRVEFVKQK